MQQREMKTDRIASQVVTRTFMSHNLSTYLPYHKCSYVFLFQTRARIQKSDTRSQLFTRRSPRCSRRASHFNFHSFQYFLIHLNTKMPAEKLLFVRRLAHTFAAVSR